MLRRLSQIDPVRADCNGLGSSLRAAAGRTLRVRLENQSRRRLQPLSLDCFVASPRQMRAFAGPRNDDSGSNYLRHAHKWSSAIHRFACGACFSLEGGANPSISEVGGGGGWIAWSLRFSRGRGALPQPGIDPLQRLRSWAQLRFAERIQRAPNRPEPFVQV